MGRKRVGKILVALAALLALIGSGLAPATAFAETATSTQVDIVGPADGASLEDWDGRWSVDFTNAPAGQYTWRISYYGGAHSGSGGGYFDSTAGVHEFNSWSAPRY